MVATSVRNDDPFPTCKNLVCYKLASDLIQSYKNYSHIGNGKAAETTVPK